MAAAAVNEANAPVQESAAKWKFPDQGDRHLELLRYIHALPNLSELQGHPDKVLAAMDDFAATRRHLMNVGAAKGKFITELIAEMRPQTVVELGGFVGYSAILFGDALRRAGGQRYLSLELNEEFAAVARRLVDLAGLGDIVRVVVGPSSRSLHELYSSGELTTVELLFLDHHKPLYTVDLRLCEHYGLIRPGSVLAADNVIVPGAPEYLAYVRSDVRTKRARAKKHERDPELELDFAGNPNLVYENTMHYAVGSLGKQDAVAISRCVGEETGPEYGHQPVEEL
ncbi:hypothetical protein VTN02DRAFT_1765 [Thermoascus thermophilus]